MENQAVLFKGELMEELLRNYFLSSGYYVLRGVKFQYEGFDVTDVDLYLYGRLSSLNRERINVDIKNKKTPQTFERIIWANGLKKILTFDSCIVATTDNRPIIHSFGELHNTIIFDGNFLNKLRGNRGTQRISEEDFLTLLAKYKSHTTFPNKDWRFIYEQSKSSLLSELDYSGFNEAVINLKYFLEKAVTDIQKREVAQRMTYVILSHILIIIDYIFKDIAFLEQDVRTRKLSDGFKFGNLGQVGIDKILTTAAAISGAKTPNNIRDAFDNIPVSILTDFFSKNENMKNVFTWAKEFEALAFNKTVTFPDRIEPNLKGIIGLFLDFNNIDRRMYFDALKTPEAKLVTKNIDTSKDKSNTKLSDEENKKDSKD